jgi:hypothetical protein
MFWLAAAAITTVTASTTPSSQAVRATVQAQATVRIMSGVLIKLDGTAAPESPAAGESIVHIEGAAQSVRLIEFQ